MLIKDKNYGKLLTVFGIFLCVCVVSVAMFILLENASDQTHHTPNAFEILESVRVAIPSGMTREAALSQSVFDDAWYKADCRGVDIFFFGNKTWRGVRIITVYYRTAQGGDEARVEGAYMVETYRVGMYKDCVSEDVLDELYDTRPFLDRLFVT